MGISIDAALIFGIPIGDNEDEELPWSDEEYEGDPDSWWDDIIGCDDLPGSPFGPDGNYLDLNDPDNRSKSDKWFEARKIHREANPCPVEFEWCGSLGHEQWVLRSPLVEKIVCYGPEPEKVNPSKMEGAAGEAWEFDHLRPMVKFMEDYDIVPTGQTGWYLCWSYSN